MNGISDVDPETIILYSDVDEIPNLKIYDGEEGVFNQKLYYYALNVFTGKTWKNTAAIKRKNLVSMNRLRSRRFRMRGIRNGGWHFSYVMPTEQIIKKIESFAHQELNTEEIKKGIAEKRSKLVDPYGRPSKQFVIEMPSGPEWLLKNKEKYNHLFYEEK